MKKIIFSAFALFTAQTLFAQLKEGTITYERKINLHKKITDEEMKAMVPEFRTSSYELLFSDKQSLYKAVPEDNAPDPFSSSSGGTVVVMKMGGDEGESYRNYDQGKLVESRPLGAKSYIIEDSIKQQAWKLTDETKTILGYKCKKATLQNEKNKQSIEAWYTEDIAVPGGPESFASLPGAILAVDINSGEIVFTATNVSDKVDKKLIQEPKKGKKITKAEYTKLLEEMFGAPGEGGRRVIMRNM